MDLSPSPTQCLSSRADGTQCRSRRLPDSPTCYFHAPENAEALAKGRLRGGLASLGRTPRAVESLAEVDCSTPEGLAEFRKGLMRLVVRGEIDPPAARASLDCAQQIAGAGQAADASASTQAMALALSKALKDQG